MSISINSYNISTIPTGMAGSDVIASINQSIGQINTALNQLSNTILQTSANSAVIRKQVPISMSCTAGTLVYFDTNTGRFEPAYAATLSEPGVNGETLESPSSRVEGMILSQDDQPDILVGDPTIHGTLLCGGYYEDSIAASYCLGENYDIQGTYYLTPNAAAPGRAVLDTAIGQHLRQPVLTNYGGGKFSLSLFYLAHDNHFHGSYAIVAGSWILADNELPPDVTTRPTGAQMWYKAPEDDLSYVNMGELSERTTAVFYNGVLQGEASDFIVAQGYLWYKGQTSPAAHSVVVFNHYPFAYDSPVVRSIESMNSALTVRNRNGLIQLMANDFTHGSTTRAAYAVSAIVGKDVSFTPVVSGLAAGPGIAIQPSLDGTATISSTDYIGYPIDAQIVNYNGAAPTSDGKFIYFTFPKGRTNSAMIVSAPINGIPDTTTLRAYLWATSAASSASFSVRFYWVQQPTATTETEMPAAAAATAALNLSASAGNISYKESTEPVTISGSGMLSALVTVAGTPTDDIQLLRIGFRLEVVSAQLALATTTVGTGVNSVINTAQSAGSIGQYTCVRVNNAGKLIACSSGTAAACNTCIGVTLNAAVGEDAEIQYMLQGVIVAEFGFTPGTSLYVGADGAITAVDPSTDTNARFIQKIGVALTANVIQINIQPGILKEQA